MRLERLLAIVLGWGTWLACGVTALGLAVDDLRIVTVGIASFIALPVVRVVIMVVSFARARDARATMIAAVVLAVLALGFALGVVGVGAA